MTTQADNENNLPDTTPNSNPTSTPSPLVAALQREHPESISEIVEALGEVTAIIPREHIVAVCLALKAGAETRFDFLSDICGADRGVAPPWLSWTVTSSMLV